MHTAESFTQTPSRTHKSKRKELPAGIERPRKRAKAIPKPEMQSMSRDNSLQQFTGSIGNTPSDILDWTHVDNNKFSDISAEAMISVGPPQNYSSNQLSVGNTNPYIWVDMDSTPVFGTDSVPTSASGSYSYGSLTKDQFDLRIPPRPQPFSVGRYSTLQYLPLCSESVRVSADKSAQPPAPSVSGIQSAWEISSQASDQLRMFTSEPSEFSAPIDMIPHTPSRHIEIPNLEITCSSVESQGQVPATPQDLSYTPTHKTSGKMRGLNILENNEEVCEVDWWKDVAKNGELGDFESFEDFLMRDKCKYMVHSGTRIQN